MADIPHNARQQNRAPRRLTKENLAFGHFFVIVEQMAKRGYLGEFEFLVILALLRLRENGYGVQVSREIERREPTVERGGRAKRYFHVTTNGLKAVRESQRALSSMWEGLPQMERA
jgi:hypothetical protein